MNRETGPPASFVGFFLGMTMKLPLLRYAALPRLPIKFRLGRAIPLTNTVPSASDHVASPSWKQSESHGCAPGRKARRETDANGNGGCAETTVSKHREKIR